MQRNKSVGNAWRPSSHRDQVLTVPLKFLQEQGISPGNLSQFKLNSQRNDMAAKTVNFIDDSKSKNRSRNGLMNAQSVDKINANKNKIE